MYIYRARDGFVKRETLGDPSLIVAEFCSSKIYLFDDFPITHNIQLIVQSRENIFSPNLVMKNSATLEQGCCRIFPLVKSIN